MSLCLFSLPPTKSFYCFGLNVGDRGIQPGLAIFPIHISIDYPEFASWKHLCWPALQTSLSALALTCSHPPLMDGSGGDDNHCLSARPWVCCPARLHNSPVWSGKKRIRSVIQWILGNQAWGFLFLKEKWYQKAGLWKRVSKKKKKGIIVN